MTSTQLYWGDCLKIMDGLIADGVKVDAVITDPPYGINYKAFRTDKGRLINDDNTKWFDKFTELSSKILKHGCHLYCFFDPEHSAELILCLRKNGFKIRNFITIPRAVKGNGGDRIFQQQFEYCLFATLGKKEEGRKFNKTNILKPSESYKKDKRYNAKEWLYRLPDNWYWLKASEHNTSSRLHPTQKTVECVETMLKISTNEGDIILDPFMGSGTTGVACKNLNRNFIGIELDLNYYMIAQERINADNA